MKESITQFDLEAAFKALDEIDIPVSEKGIKENRPALTEIFSRKSKFESLFEEYYDIGSTEELGEAKEEREGEIAKAKLKRIEKIVDLDAESPEDLLTSYVGKYIIQCPQCMTLFYKDKEDVVESEEDSSTVNVGEQCQHCGNESGYSLIGKVGEAEPEEAEVGTDELPMTDEELPTEEVPEENPEEESTEGEEDLGDFDLEALNLEDEPVEEEDKKEESFTTHEGDVLVEEVQDDKDLDAKLAAHNEYIEYLRTIIAQEEAALEKVDNEQVKAAIQRRIDAFKEDLEMALPDAVKNEVTVEIEAPIEDPVEEEGEIQEEALDNTSGETLTEALKETADLEVSAEEFENLINEPAFKKPISDIAVRAMLNSEKDSKEDVEESAEIVDNNKELEEGIFDNIKNAVSKVKDGLTNFIDTKLKSRAPTADWILKNALKDYAKASLQNDGSVETADENRKFTSFIIACFTDKFKDGTKISAAPALANISKLVKGRDPEAKQKYIEAENIAKGWSKIDGNGPAIIFMAKDATDPAAEPLCQFYKGELDQETDQLESHLERVKNGLAGSKFMKKGKAGQLEIKKLKASEIEKGMNIKLNDKDTAEVIDIAEGRLGTKITFKFDDGTTEAMSVTANYEFNVINTPTAPTTESMDNFMTEVEELQEAILEKLISDSLVETYGNVAGYRLTSCEYLSENLKVNGTIYFTSGKTRNTTYAFSEVYKEEDKVKLNGLNEKLGLDKKFTLIGRIENKTLITESFGNK